MKNQIQKNSIITNKNNKHKLGITFVCVFSVLFLFTCFNIFPPLTNLLVGIFGLLTYAIFISLILFGIMLIKNKEIFLEKYEIIFMFIWLATFVCLLHLITTHNYINEPFKTYIANVYNSKATAGGVVFSLLVYAVNSLTHIVASYLLFSILLIALTTIIIDKLYANQQFKKLNFNTKQETKHEEVKPTPQILQEDYEEEVIIKDEDYQENEQKSKAKIILGLTDKDKELNKNILQKSKEAFDFNQTKTSGNVRDYILTPKFPYEKSEINNELESETEFDKRPPKIVHTEFGVKQKPNEITEKPKKELSESDKKNLEFLRNSLGGDLRRRKLEKEETVEKPKLNFYDNSVSNTDELLQEFNENIYDPNLTLKSFNKNFNLQNSQNNFIEKQNNNIQDDFNETEIDTVFNVNEEKKEDTFKEINNFNKTEFVAPKINTPKKHFVAKPYVKPPLELLQYYEQQEDTNEEDYTQKAIMLEQTLSSFKIPATVVSVTKGPAFTRFELQMPVGVPVKRVTGYIDDIAMTLESQGAVRVEIPIPGKNAFGVEVPNETISTVGLRDILESYSFQGSKSKLTFALGKDITGECKVGRLDKMPHLLVAGATGSGKSVCLNSLIISLIYKASPQDLKIILIDPKRVEFTLYNGLPHLLIPNVITEPDKAISALTWTIEEMERRFTLFSKYRVRNLDEFNELNEVKEGIEEKIPYLVIIVDELADLMVISKKELEDKIIRIAQKSRAAGIHLVLATQRPSVNVITGIIKANLPSRIAFAVTSNTDSRTILDQGGAEKLLGKGDMLYSPNDAPDLIRIQGAYISNAEVERVVEFVKDNNDVYFDSDIEDQMFNKKEYGFETMHTAEYDPLLKDAIRNFIKSNSASISRLQRLFGIGFQRAGKIVDQLESLGFISEKDSSNNRKIYLTKEEFEERFGEEL